MSDKIPNQANFQDSQNFDIDINKIYSDFIQEIDANRSIVNISNQGNQEFLRVFKKQTISSLAKLVKVEDSPQESRCHAFFRLIGFPVISSDMRYYNPGFDNVKEIADRAITLDLKIDIANDSLVGFRALSFRRENYINSILQTFSQNTTITASTLALSSSTNIRNFSAAVQNPDPFDMSINNQSYTADFKAQIGKYDQLFLTDYVDEFGNNPTLTQLNQTRFHFIKPFMVDPRIDFTAAPVSRKVAVPFALNKNNLLIAENTFVKRPLLEKIIRDRFIVQDQSSTLGTNDQSIRNYILSVPGVQDEQLIQQMTSGNEYKLTDQLQFVKYLNIIRAMCIKLVEAQGKIQIVQSRYYWLPIPSTIGPEGGSTIKNVIISSSIPANFITDKDKSLINAILKQTANQFNSQTADVSGVPDVGGFAFDSFKNTFDSDTSEAFGDITNQTAGDLIKNRNHDLSISNDALRTIEIIMGEFSGLGLSDIISVMGALYIMPKEDLLGFLDDDSFSRMIISLDLELSNLNNPGISQAMNSFFQRIKDFYNLTDKIYQDLRQNNGLSSS